MSLSYGENPHQQAAFYRLADPRLAGPGLADLAQLSGDEPSYNNLLDLDSAYAIVADFDEPAVAIVKHNNPCGVGTGSDPGGGLPAGLRRRPPLRLRGRRGLQPRGGRGHGAGHPGHALLGDGGPRLLRAGPCGPSGATRSQRPRPSPCPCSGARRRPLPGFGLHYRPVAGGFLAQTPDAVPLSEVTFTVVSKRPPTRGGAARPALRLAGGQARPLQRLRLRPG